MPTEMSPQSSSQNVLSLRGCLSSKIGAMFMQGTMGADQIGWKFNAGVVSIPAECGQLRVAVSLSVAVSKAQYSLALVSVR
ncbi:hypothetical protein [Bradyrhizobium sp. JR3.5]